LTAGKAVSINEEESICGSRLLYKRITIISGVERAMKFHLVVAVAAAVSAAGIMCSNNPSVPEHVQQGQEILAIVLNDDAVMRIDPILYSGRVGLLKKTEVVEILGKSKEKASVGNDRNYWFRVKSKDGLTGWIFGANLQLLSDKSKRGIDNYISGFYEKEAERLRNVIGGKWWSVDDRGDFTNHGLEIWKEGKYRSYLKGGKEIKGEFNIDVAKSEVVFLNGTTFEGNLNITRRGTFIYLERKDEANPMKFTKTSDTAGNPVEGQEVDQQNQEQNANQ